MRSLPSFGVLRVRIFCGLAFYTLLNCLLPHFPTFLASKGCPLTMCHSIRILARSKERNALAQGITKVWNELGKLYVLDNSFYFSWKSYSNVSAEKLTRACIRLFVSPIVSLHFQFDWPILTKLPFFRKSAFERNYESEVSNDFFTDLHFACIRQSMQGLRQLLASLAIFLL